MDDQQYQMLGQLPSVVSTEEGVPQVVIIEEIGETVEIENAGDINQHLISGAQSVSVMESVPHSVHYVQSEAPAGIQSVPRSIHYVQSETPGGIQVPVSPAPPTISVISSPVHHQAGIPTPQSPQQQPRLVSLLGRGGQPVAQPVRQQAAPRIILVDEKGRPLSVQPGGLNVIQQNISLVQQGMQRQSAPIIVKSPSPLKGASVGMPIRLVGSQPITIRSPGQLTSPGRGGQSITITNMGQVVSQSIPVSRKPDIIMSHGTQHLMQQQGYGDGNINGGNLVISDDGSQPQLEASPVLEAHDVQTHQVELIGEVVETNVGMPELEQEPQSVVLEEEQMEQTEIPQIMEPGEPVDNGQGMQPEEPVPTEDAPYGVVVEEYTTATHQVDDTDNQLFGDEDLSDVRAVESAEETQDDGYLVEITEPASAAEPGEEPHEDELVPGEVVEDEKLVTVDAEPEHVESVLAAEDIEAPIEEPEAEVEAVGTKDVEEVEPIAVDTVTENEKGDGEEEMMDVSVEPDVVDKEPEVQEDAINEEEKKTEEDKEEEVSSEDKEEEKTPARGRGRPKKKSTGTTPTTTKTLPEKKTPEAGRGRGRPRKSGPPEEKDKKDKAASPSKTRWSLRERKEKKYEDESTGTGTDEEEYSYSEDSDEEEKEESTEMKKKVPKRDDVGKGYSGEGFIDVDDDDKEDGEPNIFAIIGRKREPDVKTVYASPQKGTSDNHDNGAREEDWMAIVHGKQQRKLSSTRSPEGARSEDAPKLTKMQTMSNQINARMSEKKPLLSSSGGKKIDFKMKGMKFTLNRTPESTAPVRKFFQQRPTVYTPDSYQDKPKVSLKKKEEKYKDQMSRDTALDKKEQKLKALDRELDERAGMLRAKEGKLARFEIQLKAKEQQLIRKEINLGRPVPDSDSDQDTRKAASPKKGARKSQGKEDDPKAMKRQQAKRGKELDAKETLLEATETQLTALGQELFEKFEYLKSKELVGMKGEKVEDIIGSEMLEKLESMATPKKSAPKATKRKSDATSTTTNIKKESKSEPKPKYIKKEPKSEPKPKCPKPSFQVVEVESDEEELKVEEVPGGTGLTGGYWNIEASGRRKDNNLDTDSPKPSPKKQSKNTPSNPKTSSLKKETRGRKPSVKTPDVKSKLSFKTPDKTPQSVSKQNTSSAGKRTPVIRSKLQATTTPSHKKKTPQFVSKKTPSTTTTPSHKKKTPSTTTTTLSHKKKTPQPPVKRTLVTSKVAVKTKTTPSVPRITVRKRERKEKRPYSPEPPISKIKGAVKRSRSAPPSQQPRKKMKR